MVEDRASEATLPMTDRSRGIVVPFRRRRPNARRMPSGAAETAKKAAPCLVRLRERRDVALNADWDRFMTLVIEAWCWRDPDCFAAVEDCLAHLRRSVDHDWS
jgi:hypothetical protein